MESNADRFRFVGWPEPKCNHYWVPIHYQAEPNNLNGPSRPGAKCTMCGQLGWYDLRYPTPSDAEVKHA